MTEKDYLTKLLIESGASEEYAVELSDRYITDMDTAPIVVLNQLDEVVGEYKDLKEAIAVIAPNSTKDAFKTGLKAGSIKHDGGFVLRRRDYLLGLHLTPEFRGRNTPLWKDCGDGYKDEVTGVVISKESLPMLKNATLIVSNTKRKYEDAYIIASFKGHIRKALHRLITNAPKGMVVDHKDGNTLNNRLSNLRLTTTQGNVLNRGSRAGVLEKKTVKYKGVYLDKKGVITMEASVMKQRVRKRRITSEERAAKLYDVVMLYLAGEFSRTNFLRENYSHDFIERFGSLYLRGYKRFVNV